MNKHFQTMLSGLAILIGLISISLSLTSQGPAGEDGSQGAIGSQGPSGNPGQPGNRNPYVDDASYICLVYGMTSMATRQACGLA